ncbi:MAG: EscU/YscU/HrcU family type III secretion system export apparatus switch protein [Pseudomonadota bacterium]
MAEGPNGGGEKTEAPTPKKRKDSAKKGDVLQSKELGTALMIIAGTLAFWLFGNALVGASGDVVRSGLRFDNADIASFDIGTRTLTLLTPLLLPFGGLFALLIVAAIATPAVLGSAGFRWSAVKPKPSKLNPMSGLKRMFGTNGLIELGKSLAKVTLLGVVGIVIIVRSLPEMAELGHGSVSANLMLYGDMFNTTLLAMAGALAIIAMIDVPAQIYQHTKKLKMTKQEVKDENKETEGSPELKQAVRQRQQEVLNGSIRKGVEEATVLLVNPTHFAVALRYDQENDAAPVVLARGRGGIAQAMRELAEEKDVPVMRYPELTRAIYFTSQAGAMVDERLYLAVATLLAFIFRLDAQMASKADRPRIIVPDDMHYDSDGKKGREKNA